MTPDRVRSIIDAYGANPKRWPQHERYAALALIQHDTLLAAYRDEAAQLDALMTASRPTVSAALLNAVLAAAPSPRSQNAVSKSRPFASHILGTARALWPELPLWQPAIGLAASLAIGIFVGAAGIMPASDTTTQTELAALLSDEDAASLILYGVSGDFEDWAYDG